MSDSFYIARWGGNEAVPTLGTIPDINVVDEQGKTLLHAAVSYRNLVMVSEFLRRGIDCNAQDRNGQTALHYSGQLNRADISELLLSNGAKVDVVDRHGNTALWYAVFSAHQNYDNVRTFLRFGAQRVATTVNKSSRSPLDFAKQIGDMQLIRMLEGEQ